MVFFAVILSSSVALLKSAAPNSSWFSKVDLAILAIMPGILLIFSNTFKFEEKAKWNKLKQRTLEGLQRKLLFENVPVEEVSRQITIELEKLEGIRVQLAKPVIK